MKLLIILLLCAIWLTSCSSTRRMDALEDKVNDTRYEVRQVRHELDSIKRVKSPVWDY